MRAGQARDIAREWVHDEATTIPGFVGAYFAGSITWLADDAILPHTSDVDIMIVLDGPVPAQKPGKFIHEGALLEASFLALGDCRTPEQILAQDQLAGGFRTPSVIADSTGHLTALQAAVGRDFAKRRWVRARADHAMTRVRNGLDRLNASDPFPTQVIGWLFPTGVTTHVLLDAGLRNPTVRSRYVAVRELLREYGRDDVHETLLGLLGCATMTPDQVERHLLTMTEAFDDATEVIKSPFPFASDITAAARPIAIDGSRDLIHCGLHREAVFWIAATYSRCHQVFSRDATERVRERHSAGYGELVSDLGIRSYLDLTRRAGEVRAFLPDLWRIAEAIMAANPEIED